jgi:multiple sugar transport system ATP-binding protein
MIYVTHDQTEAMTLGNRIAVLNRGKLMQLDTPLHLYNHPANKFVAGFIGSPTMNFLSGTIEHDNDYFLVCEIDSCRFFLGSSIPDPVKNYIGKKIQIGIRPEHLLIDEGDQNPESEAQLEILAYENMGNEQFVYLSLGLQTLIVRRLPLETSEVGKRKSIQLLADRIIYFDEHSGQVINSEKPFSKVNS